MFENRLRIDHDSRLNHSSEMEKIEKNKKNFKYLQSITFYLNNKLYAYNQLIKFCNTLQWPLCEWLNKLAFTKTWKIWKVGTKFLNSAVESISYDNKTKEKMRELHIHNFIYFITPTNARHEHF
jgi:hypothetical protein